MNVKHEKMNKLFCFREACQKENWSVLKELGKVSEKKEVELHTKYIECIE